MMPCACRIFHCYEDGWTIAACTCECHQEQGPVLTGIERQRIEAHDWATSLLGDVGPSDYTLERMYADVSAGRL